MQFDRTNMGLVGRWWWTVDRYTLFALLLLLATGAVLVTAGSPPVARRIGLPDFYFVHRHHIFLMLSALVMFVVSLLPPLQIRRLAVLLFLGSVSLMLLVLVVGVEVKGARRWLSLFGMSIQPSEFMKPCFAVVMGWVCAEMSRIREFPGYRVAIALYAVVALLLIAQPDFGMTLTVSSTWGLQLFLAGLPFIWIGGMLVAGVFGVWLAYMLLPHVTRRIDSFLDPSSGDNYQIGKALEAFKNGGIFGRGPGEGQIKQFVPDSHTDFIFSVAGEEFGMIACLLILSLFAFIVIRGFVKIWDESDRFVMIAVAGLLAQFGIQSIVNMGVAINLLPAKGMTLPFLSYGGSSLLAIALGMGMMLALTRKRYGPVTS